MAETLTTHYSWTKPDPGASANTWGATLNADLDKIDATVWANQQAGVPIGSITMFGGATAPTNWLICNGASLSTTGTYAALFAIIGYTYGGSGANFNLPNMGAQFPIGVGTNHQGVGTSLGEVAGAFAVTLATANLPAHAHSITDVTHNHGVNQWAHNHTIVTGNHAHGITTGSHSHAIPYDLVNPSGGGLTSGGSSFALAGGQRTDTAGNLGGNTDTAGNLGGYTDTQGSGISNQASGTNLSTTQNTGSGAAFSVVPPLVALNFIVRYQ